MNDTDIIKALEMLLDKIRAYECENVSISKKEIENTLDLINRLEKTNRKNERIIELADKTIETQKAEIERLQSDNVKLHTIIPKMLVEAKSEAIKEFCEKRGIEYVEDDV